MNKRISKHDPNTINILPNLRIKDIDRKLGNSKSLHPDNYTENTRSALSFFHESSVTVGHNRASSSMASI